MWWAIQNSDNFEDAVILAVNRGHDADTLELSVASLPGGCMAIQLFQIDGLRGSLRSPAFGLAKGLLPVNQNSIFYRRAAPNSLLLSKTDFAKINFYGVALCQSIDLGGQLTDPLP